MADPIPDASPEKPTDPEMLRLQARVRALMLIGGLTLGVGLSAVFAAIIYRVAAPSDKGSAAVAEETMTLAPATAAPPAPAVASEAAAPAANEAPAPPAATSPAVAKAVEVVKSVLPVRAWLVSTSVSGDRIVLAYEHAGGTTMFVVDAVTLEITGRLDLKPQSQ
jgi:hypothetical protein